MVSINNFKKLSFLVYGLGTTGLSVINFLKKMVLKITKYGMIKIKIYIKNLDQIILLKQQKSAII